MRLRLFKIARIRFESAVMRWIVISVTTAPGRLWGLGVPSLWFSVKPSPFFQAEQRLSARWIWQHSPEISQVPVKCS
jgi:hypothetical protein